MMPADAHDPPYTTLTIALAVLIVLTLTIAPLRLPMLLIPGSFLLASYGMGLLLERMLWIRSLLSDSPMLTLVVRLGTGMCTLGWMTTVFALMGLYRFSALPVIAALGWGMMHVIRSYGEVKYLKPTIPSVVNGLFVGIGWAIAWLWGTIPPTFYDELVYHLPIPQLALRTGHLPALPWLVFSFMPHLSDLLLGWGLAFSGEIGARAMHFTFWIAIWLAGWAFVEAIVAPHSHPWIGGMLAGAFASSAMFFFLGTLPFAETLLTFAVLASAAVIACPGSHGLWLVLGLLWSLAASAKLSGWIWVAGGALAALSMRWPARVLLKSGAAALAITFPWWGRAWWLTGNPIFPLGYRWLGGLYWSEASQARLQGDLPSYDSLTPLGLLKLPYDMVMNPERFGSASDCGPLAVAMVCLMLTLPLWTRVLHLDQVRRRQGDAAGLFIGFATLCWILTSTTTRFFAPALMVGLSTLVVMLTRLPRRVLLFFLVLLSACGLVGASRFLSVHNRVFSSMNVALERESAGAFASRTLDQYETAMYVRNHLAPEAHLLFIGESRPYYFDRPALFPYPFHEHPLTRWVEEADSSEQLLHTLRNHGFTHVVLNTKEFRRLHDGYHLLDFTGPQAARHDKILKELPRTMTMLFAKNNVYVFEIPLSGELQGQTF
jgi:hypothetical protein